LQTANTGDPPTRDSSPAGVNCPQGRAPFGSGTLRSIAASFVKTASGDIDDSQDGDDNIALRDIVVTTK
jgi:hypothetical protein